MSRSSLVSSSAARMRSTAWAVCIAAALVLAASAAAEVAFHVAATGSDANSGTRRKPFATLERARQAVRQAGADKVRRVIVHGGSYELRATFTLGQEDSGTPTRPVVWEAAPDETVRLVGGMSVPPTAWHAVAEPAVLQRLPAEARAHVLVADLAALGVSSVASWPTKFRGAPEAPELFFNDQRMQVAHWPNRGWAIINKVIDAGAVPREGDKSDRLPVFTCADPRPRSWNSDAGIWLRGEFTYNWYDEIIRVKSINGDTGQITLAAPALYGVKSGRFYALNLLEELDEPGEYYIEATTRRLYFWPPASTERARLVLSTLNAPLLSTDNARHISFSGMTFENGLGDAINVSGGSGVRIERCTVRNVRQLGIRVNGGSDHLVYGCKIYDTGTGGLYLGGGDRRTLTPAHHLAINNHIHDFSRLQLTGAYAITLAGVGNRAAHNLIHDAPHQAILIAGNDNVVEYNIVRKIVADASDAGALYKGRDPSCRGNVIRYNFFQDIGHPASGTCAVYFDDGDGGDSVIGNIFLRCMSGGGFGAVFSHGGFDIRAENNIFIDCQRALASTPWGYPRWKDALNGGQDCHWLTKLLKDVDITSEVYIQHYPELAGFMNPQPNTPRQSHARNNVLVRCGQISNGNWKWDAETMWSTSADPGFVDAAHDDFRQRADAELFRHLPGFKPIPFEQIGPRPQSDH